MAVKECKPTVDWLNPKISVVRGMTTGSPESPPAYSSSPTVGNPIASILKRNVEGIPEDSDASAFAIELSDEGLQDL